MNDSSLITIKSDSEVFESEGVAKLTENGFFAEVVLSSDKFRIECDGDRVVIERSGNLSYRLDPSYSNDFELSSNGFKLGGTCESGICTITRDGSKVVAELSYRLKLHGEAEFTPHLMSVTFFV